MGIRFNRIESVEGNGNIINVEKNGEAIVVGRARRPQTLNLFRFDQNQIFNKSFQLDYRITTDNKFVNLRKFQNDFVLYGSNQEGNIIKLTLNSQNDHTSEEYYSQYVIKSTQYHPTQNSLVVLDSRGIQLIQQNYTVLNIENSTIKNSQMRIQRIDGVNHFFVGIIEGEENQQSFFNVYKTEQLAFGSSYSTPTTFSEYIANLTSSIQKSFYFEKNKFVVFDTPFKNYFFDLNLNYILIPEELGSASSFILSKTQDKIIYKSQSSSSYFQSQDFCSYNYVYEDKALIFVEDTKNCIDLDNFDLSSQLLSIQGIEYPVLYSTYQVKAYDWNLTNIMIEYVNQEMKDFSTMKQNSLLQISSQFDDHKQNYYVNEYDIVPISVGGIVGLVFGCIIGFILLMCFFCFALQPIINNCRECCRKCCEDGKVNNKEDENTK